MVDVIIDGEVAYCLPDCTCCTACHKLITEVDECPFSRTVRPLVGFPHVYPRLQLLPRNLGRKKN